MKIYVSNRFLFIVYRWKSISQSECSAQCGPGTRTQSITCVQEYEKRAPSQLPDTMCSHLSKPPSSVPCVGQCLESKWSFTEWTPVRLILFKTIRIKLYKTQIFFTIRSHSSGIIISFNCLFLDFFVSFKYNLTFTLFFFFNLCVLLFFLCIIIFCKP